MLAAIAASPSRTFIAVTSAFCLGIVAHAVDERPWAAGAVCAAAVLLSVVALVANRTAASRLLAFAAIAVVFGIWRYDAVLAHAAHPPAGEGAFMGTVAAAPMPGIRFSSIRIDPAQVRVGNGWRDAGRMTLRLPHAADPPAYGDIVTWTCDVPEGRAECFVHAIIPAGRVRGTPLLRALFRFRDAFRAAIRSAMPEPEASITLGLLIGDRGGIPQDLLAAFRASGTSHILAVSGYNVSKVAGIALVAFCAVTARRRIAAAVAAFSVMGFAAVAGGEPSVVRAAVMGCLALAAAFLGRRYSGATALPAAAAAMLAIDPTLVRHDVGFLLSFSALLGLHAFAPGIASVLRMFPDAFGMRRAFAESVAASLATLPVVLATFGTSPILGPVANVLVLPIIPAIMLSGACAALAASAGTAVQAAVAIPAIMGIRYVEVVTRAFASVPFAIELRTGPFATAAIAVALALIAVALRRRAHARERGMPSSYVPT